MHTWNIYHTILGACAGSVQAPTKAAAEAKAFEKYGKPMIVDLDRQEARNAALEHLQ